MQLKRISANPVLWTMLPCEEVHKMPKDPLGRADPEGSGEASEDERIEEESNV